MSNEPHAKPVPPPGFSLAAEPLKRKPELSGAVNESLAIGQLSSMFNNTQVTGSEAAEVFRTLEGMAKAIPDGSGTVPTVAVTPVAELPAPIVTVAPTHADPRPQRIFFTGRLGIGKDYCAAAAGYQVLGFADPIYELASHFFGVKVDATSGKDAPGMRTFLQTVGQWGRGDVTPQYPYTPTRALFITMIRSLTSAQVLPKWWENFGSANFWADYLIERAAQNAGFVAVTNCRFANEYKLLKDAGWTHFHVIASGADWASRLSAKRLTPQSPECNDVSEQLARKLDKDLSALAKQPGGKLRVVWNSSTPSPSPRLHTLNEFLSATMQPKTEEIFE